MTDIFELRAPDENDAAWKAFLAYLENRNAAKCAELIGKSQSTINRWSARFSWKERARQYDNALLEETRQELRRRLANSFLRRWQDYDELAAAAADALRAKITSATPRTLNEILTAATEKQLAMIDKLRVLEDTDNAGALEIRIVDATGGEISEPAENRPRNKPSKAVENSPHDKYITACQTP